MWQSIIRSIQDALRPQNMLQAGKDFIMNNPELTVGVVSEAAKKTAEKAKEVLKGHNG